MTTKRIVFTRPDGGVSVMVPTDAHIANLMASGLTEVQAVEAVKISDVPPGSTDIIITEFANIPTDRLFRDDWRRTGAAVPAVDMSIARRRHALRIASAKRLAISILGEREDELRMSGRTVAADAVATDITAIENINRATISTQISGAATPNDLRAIWPTILNEFKPF